MTRWHPLLVLIWIAVMAVPAGAAPPPARRHPPAVPHAAAASRTLDAVHIDGEIPVPQVLFITARDQRRFADFQHRRYLETSAGLGARTVYPSWILVSSTRNTPGKEINR